ncbi:hypothetical protein PV328_005583 [Microctonus aethiopoides]|uniref:Nose resistant-to-fluoxetine protein N-terminal domain-containing protein n=1 Tax=Microctonus aethiopoides TaxID=144406 RepID=A0AA39KSF3_9HYME|nr:hypothetical protein PV328_005583 [Microctonus aethiopoides]
MARYWIELILLIWINLCIILTIADDNTVDILPSSSLDSLDNDEIIRVLTNDNESVTENFTSELLLNELKNTVQKFWTTSVILKADKSNPYYEKFADKINIETQRLLEIVPGFDPGAGNVSSSCKKHSKIFQRELKKLSLWALKMYDATAKVPSGLLSGNVNQFGDFDECLSVEGSEGIRGKYCLAFIQLNVDQSRPDLKHLHRLVQSHYLFKNNYTDLGHRIPRFGTIHWAVCIPEMCTANDVEIALHNTLEKYVDGTGINFTFRVEREMCQVQNTKSLPRETIIVGLFFTGLIILSISAAIFEYYNVNVSEIILAFSLKRNYLKLVSLKQSNDDIPTLHGIRALNAFLLILGHKSMALIFIPFMNRTEMSESLGHPWTVIGRAASLYTDPFIMLSGLLTSYSMIKQFNNNGCIDIKKEYISRFFRLVPTLIALILFCTYIVPQLGSGPMWNLVINHHAENCKKCWWRNLLFIHNYCGFEKICLTHTHHIGIDTQLFIFSPIMVWLMYKWPKYGSIILGGLAIISTGLRYFVAYYKELNTYVYFGASTQQLFDTANFSYSLPTHRLTIYIIGIFIGYLLRIYPEDYKMNKSVIKLGWIFSSLATFSAFFGPANMGSIDYVYKPHHGAIYNAFAPIGWCAIFAWIIFLSHTKNTNAWISRFFAWRGFIIWTRLSYAIYLTQFPVFFYNVGQTRNPHHFAFIRLMFNIPELMFIIITAVILTLLVDMPFQNIKYYLLKTKREVAVINKANKIE